MRLLHALTRTHASFDDPDLVSHAGLVPVMALAGRACGVPADLGEQLDAARNAAAAGTLSGTRCRQRPRGRR